jgi:hypothetical protein
MAYQNLLSTAFIDLASYEQLDSHMYGSTDVTDYFVRVTKKAPWFSQIPARLTTREGTPDFNQTWTVGISRAGDRLLHTWFRVTLPAVTLRYDPFNGRGRLRWTRNFMHNLIRQCKLYFNDDTIASFDNYHLDFWSAFTIPDSKSTGYNNMIGNIPALIEGTRAGITIPATTLNLPLPFFFSRDTGHALPTGSLVYTDMRIELSFRDYTELLIVDSTDNMQSIPCDASYLDGGAPRLELPEVWGNYTIVSGAERRQMAFAPRDIIIERVQTAPVQVFSPLSNPQPSYSLNTFRSAVKVLFFAVRNTTNKAEWSNYTCASPTYDDRGILNLTPRGATNPIDTISLRYSDVARLADMGSDYFSLMQPWCHAPTIPTSVGYHMYSYSLDINSVDPMGSTNFGRFNAEIFPKASPAAVVSAATGVGNLDDGNYYPQTYEFIITAVTHNVITMSQGLCVVGMV